MDDERPADPDEIFANFGDLFADFFGQHQVDDNGDVSVAMALTPEELVSGTARTVELERSIECDQCGTTTCPACDGRGQVIRTQGFFQISTTCAGCNGRRIADPACPSCGGETTARDAIEVAIPPGSEVGQVVAVEEAGRMSKDGKRRGHLYVHLQVTEVVMPRATISNPKPRRPPDTVRLALGLAAVLAAAVILSLLF